MSETLQHGPVQVQEAVSAEHYGRKFLTGLGILAAGAGVGIVAHGGSESVNPFHAQAASADTLAQGQANCGGTLTLEEHRADRVVGSPESLFPSLSRQMTSGGQEVLDSTANAKLKIRNQLATDDRVLAVFKAFFMDTRDARQLPDTATLERANKYIELYKNNKDKAAQDAAAACQLVEFLKPVRNFAVTRGQATEIQADHAGGHLTRIHTETINSTRSYEGFSVGDNYDDGHLTEDDIHLRKKLADLMVISIDGTIVVNQIIGPGSFKIENNKNNTPATIRLHGKMTPVEITPSGHIIRASTGAQQQSRGGGSSNASANNNVSHTGGGGAAGSGHGKAVGPHGQTPENLQNGPLTGPHGAGPSTPGGAPEATPGVGQTPGPGGPGAGAPGVEVHIPAFITPTQTETIPTQTVTTPTHTETSPPPTFTYTTPPPTETTPPPTTTTTPPTTTTTTAPKPPAPGTQY